jgi:hypothetical protein
MSPNHRASIIRVLRVAAVVGIAAAIASTVQAQGIDGFDHAGTRFPLTGAHTREPCESCHVGALFRGTPTRCDFCHDGTGTRAETSKDRDHIRSSNDCESCHTTLAWSDVRFDHGLVSDRCSACHDGRSAEGKPNDHVRTRSECDVCHRTLTWAAVRFDHSNAEGRCRSCHDGRTATGKPRDHIRTSAECDTCHRTRSWKRVRFDHSAVTGSCKTCHNGRQATGKPNDHFVTSEDCNVCHQVTGWGRIRFTHTSGGYPGEHRRQLDCADCHRNNRQDRPWRNASYAPDCAGCHANDFERDEHKKIDSPRTFYTVSELRDCTGACHVYKDASMSEISDRRTRHHRITDSEFDD